MVMALKEYGLNLRNKKKGADKYEETQVLRRVDHFREGSNNKMVSIDFESNP